MTQLTPRRLIHIPSTGAIIVVPTEDELINMLTSTTKRATESCAALFKAFGVDGRTTVHMTPAAKEVRLRLLFAKYTGRKMSRTRSVPGSKLKLVEKAAPKAGLGFRAPSPMDAPKHGSKQDTRAAQCRDLAKKGLPQSEIAKKLKLSQPYVSQLLKRPA